MADEPKETVTPPAETVTPEKLDKPLLGKYYTVEGAENAIKAAEREMHAATTRAANAERELGALKAIPTTPTHREETTEEREAVAQALLTDTPKFMREFADGITQRVVNLAKVNAEVYVESRLVIHDYMKEHPEVGKNAKLFKPFFTDATGSTLVERLENARKAMADDLGVFTTEARKNADAEQKVRSRAAASPGADDAGDAGSGNEDASTAGDEPETQESYLASRESQIAKVKGMA
jgi:hypothetical protein